MSPQQGLASVQRPVTADVAVVVARQCGVDAQSPPQLGSSRRAAAGAQERGLQARGVTQWSSDLKRVNLVEAGMWQPLDDVAWGATIALLRDAIALAYV
jgi:hypothetical protein